MQRTINIINFFHENKNALAQISQDELRDIINIATLILIEKGCEESIKEIAFNVLCDAVMQDCLSLEERWTLYWNLKTRMFMTTQYDAYEKKMRNMYISFYEEVKRNMPETLFQDDFCEKKDGPIVIVTSQFLSEVHAPTRRVLDYAYTIKVKLGIPVKIINDAGMYYNIFPYIAGCIQLNYCEKLNEYGVLCYKDVEFDFLQVPIRMPNLNMIEQIVYHIKNLNPRLVINVGGCSLVADLCSNFVKTMILSCSTSLPCSVAENLVLCRELRKEDEHKIQELLPEQKVIESTFNYILHLEDDMESYSRSMFNIPEDAWLLAAAGNRMQEELDTEFLRTVDGILEKIENCHFIVIGMIDNIEPILIGIKNRERIHFLGGLKDGSQAIRLADIYIQPTRKGGGRAAFEALFYGVPVIVTNYGDAWDVCGNEFSVESYDTMAERVIEYYENRELYRVISERSKRRGAILEDMEGMLKKLFLKLEI